MKLLRHLITILALTGATAIADPPNTSPALDPAELDKLAAPYIAQARATYPAAKRRFLAGLPRGYTFLVRLHFTEPQKHQGKTYFEEMLVQVQRIADGRVYGRLSNQPEALTSIKRGDSVSKPESEISDWIIERPDGSEEGNVVGKFLERHFSHQ